MLWSLSRAPDADSALQTMVRLADALGGDWPQLNSALLKDRGLRGRLFAVIGSSLALGDHLVANPVRGISSKGMSRCRTPPNWGRLFDACIGEFGTDPMIVMPQLRILYRDRLLVLAALDTASTVENEPVPAFSTIGEHLSDIADAALGAALRVASATVCKDGTQPPRLAVIAMGKCGARELNYVSDVDVIFVGEDADSVTTRVAGGEMIRLASDTFFEVDAGLRPEGKQGAGADPRFARRLLPAVGQDLGVPGAAQSQARRRRPGAGSQYMAALMPMVWSACEREDFVPRCRPCADGWRHWCRPTSATARSSWVPAACATSNSRSSSCNWCTVAPTTRSTSRRRFPLSRRWPTAVTSDATMPPT